MNTSDTAEHAAERIMTGLCVNTSAAGTQRELIAAVIREEYADLEQELAGAEECRDCDNTIILNLEQTRRELTVMLSSMIYRYPENCNAARAILAKCGRS